MSKQNSVQLITYPDSLGNNLKDLKSVLDSYFKEAVKGVHILPFYPSSVDRGFGPLTHNQVDPNFGNWQDIQSIAKEYYVMADVVVNHISDESEYFKDYIKYGKESKFADMFIDLRTFFPDNNIDLEQMNKVYVRKPVLPILDVKLENGEEVKLWNTFFKSQVDLNTNSPVTRKVFSEYIARLGENYIKYIRLDALGYVTKKIGTSCFFEEPEIYEILGWFHLEAGKYDIEILPEIHLNHLVQKKLTDKNYYSYDFALPVLVLECLYSKNAKNLKNWLKIRPHKQFTVLDTHDGIGMVDVDGLLSKEQIETVSEILHKNGGSDLMIASGAGIQNLDVYQINCTYYSALNQDDRAYLAARAIQLFTPGIPQIYYVGLLAGKNDIDLLNQTKHGRDINRHYYKLDEIESEINRTVVKNLLILMDFRNTYEAFDGNFELFDTADNIIKMGWTNKNLKTVLTVNTETYNLEIEFFDALSNRSQNLNLI